MRNAIILLLIIIIIIEKYLNSAGFKPEIFEVFVQSINPSATRPAVYFASYKRCFFYIIFIDNHTKYFQYL